MKNKRILMIAAPLVAVGAGAVFSISASQAELGPVAHPNTLTQLDQTRQRLQEALPGAKVETGPKLAFKAGTLTRGVLRSHGKSSVCTAVSFARGGGSVGCQDSESGQLERPAIGTTYLGDDAFGLTAAFPAGAHDVTLTSLDGTLTRPVALASDSVVLELSKAEIGELVWVDAAGKSHAEAVGQLVAETLR